MTYIQRINTEIMNCLFERLNYKQEKEKLTFIPFICFSVAYDLSLFLRLMLRVVTVSHFPSLNFAG